MEKKHSIIRLILCFVLAAALLPVPGVAFADTAPSGYPEIRQDIDFGGLDVYFYDWWSTDYWDAYDNQSSHTDEQEAQHAYRLWLQNTYHVQVHAVAGSDWGSIADDMIAFSSRGGEAGMLAMFTQRSDEVMRIISAGGAAPIAYNMTQGKWNRADSTAATVKGKTYAAYKGTSEPRQCLFFNKRILGEAGIDWNELYDAQGAGTWTWEMLTNVLSRVKASGVAAPITGKRDDLLKIAVYSGGGAFVGQNDQGDIYSAADSDETKASLEWALRLWNNYGLPQPEDSSWDWYMQAWAEGQAAFYIVQSYEGFNSGFSGLEDPWGCLVFPKKSEEKKYVNLSSNNVMMIPACYSSATVDKLMFLYDMWTLDTPGFPAEDNFSEQFGDLTDERAIDTYRLLSDPENQIPYILLEDENSSLGPNLLWIIDLDNLDEITSKYSKKLNKRCREINSDFIGGYISVFPHMSFKAGARIDFAISQYDLATDQYVHLLVDDGEDLTSVAVLKAWDTSTQAETSSIPAAETAGLASGQYYLTLGPDKEYDGINQKCVAYTEFMIYTDGLDVPEFRDVTPGSAPGTDVSGKVIMPEGTVEGYIELYRLNGTKLESTFYWDELSVPESHEVSFSIPGLYMAEAGEYQIQVTALSHYINEESDSGIADSDTAVYNFNLEGESVPACPAVVLDPTVADYPDSEITYTVPGAEAVAYQFISYNLATGENEAGSNVCNPVSGETGTLYLDMPGRYEFTFWARINGIWSTPSEKAECILNPAGYLDIPEVSLGGDPVGDAVTGRRTDDLTFTVSCEHASWFACDIYEQLTSGDLSYYDSVDVNEQDGAYTFTLDPESLPDPSYLLRVTPYGEDGYSSSGAKTFLLAFADDGVDTLSWELNSGVLTISGNGYMADYDWGDAPWYHDCNAIREIRIGSGVKSIGNYAFPDCQNLVSVTIPDTVSRIGQQAFSWCNSLERIPIPAGVTDIGFLAFSECSSLSAFLVDSANTQYSSENGVLFNKDKTELLMYPTAKTGAYTVPDGVTSIKEFAFSDCSYLTDVTIPDSVTRIGSNAFCRTGLVNIVIPASVVQIDYDAFTDCASLLNINVDEGNPNYASEDGVFFNKSKTTLDTYPCGRTGDYTIPDGVTYISDYAFAGCGGLTGIVIPESVTFIDYCAFAGCNNLADVWYYGDQEQWWNIRFDEGNDTLTGASLHYILHGECGENLTWVLDPYGVLTISGTGPMNDYPRGTQPPWRWNAAEITKIEIGDNVTHIGTRAFWFASSITELNIPASVESIGSEAFAGCISLERFSVDSGNTNYSSLNGDLFNSDCSVLVAYPGNKADTYSIPDGVTAIGPGAFGSMPIKEVTIPAGVTEIGEYAFAACTGLQSIVIPESVASISNYAFADCSRLSDVCYGGSEDQWYEISIGEGNECLTEADILYNTTELTGEITWKLNKKGDVLTISGTGRMKNYEYEEFAPWYEKRTSVKTVVIEDGVTGIGNCAFANFKKLTTVTMADSVTRIGNYAFRECTALTNVPLSNGLTDIGSAAFEGCSALSSVTLPGSLQTIGSTAFACCNLSSVHVADGAEAKTFDFFYGRYNTGDYHDYLYHISLPSGVTEVGYGAFCENPLPHDTPDFVLPAGTKTIEAEAFSGIGARFVWIPEQVASIGDDAFSGCTKLEYVFIPYSCTSFGNNAFPEGTKIIVIGSDSDAAEYAAGKYELIIFEYPFGGNG